MRTTLYKDETDSILRACNKVSKTLGWGFVEGVYHEALCVEFQARDIPYISRPLIPVHYEGVALQTGCSPSFVLYQRIVLDIKAAEILNAQHRAQTLSFIKASGYVLGLLVNFGRYPKLEHERFVCSDGPYVKFTR